MSKKPVLYLMCGPAGSGKSTWVRNHAKPGVSAHISRDRIRFEMIKDDEYYFAKENEVYDEFIKEITEALTSPWVEEVYADATHLTSGARQKLIKLIDAAIPAWSYDIISVIVMPELEICLSQNAQRKGRECVPETVIRSMYNSFQHPLKDDLYYKYIYENDKIVKGEVSE